MKQPRDLATTLPSPSEMDNYHKCPCLWWLKDRLWIKPVGEVIPLLTGRIVDRVMDAWHNNPQDRNPLAALGTFDLLVEEAKSKVDENDFAAFASSARDALVAWFTLYGNVKEKVTHVQPKLPICRGKVDYIVEMSPGIVRVRERKLLSPFAEVDDEVARYQLGFQPLAYATDVEQTYQVVVECVEFEFLIRSAPQRGRYKAIPASVRREPIFVDDWKKQLWRNSAEWTNYCMNALEATIQNQEAISEGKGFPFEEIPRHTRNCLTKLGTRTYECDFYKACKTNTSPTVMEEHFSQDEIVKEGEHEGS